MNSESYIKELNQLVEMDLNLHLLELQDVPIPMTPPPEVPPLPLLPESLFKPDVPPKSEKITIASNRSTVLSESSLDGIEVVQSEA